MSSADLTREQLWALIDALDAIQLDDEDDQDDDEADALRPGT